jgi:chromosome segregation ATPase
MSARSARRRSDIGAGFVREAIMADEADLRFLGEQMKHLQSDVRQVKTDMAQMRADGVKVESDVAALRADLTRIENKLEAFRESVDDRFDQNVELLKSSFRTLSNEIKALKKS